MNNFQFSSTVCIMVIWCKSSFWFILHGSSFNCDVIYLFRPVIQYNTAGWQILRFTQPPSYEYYAFFQQILHWNSFFLPLCLLKCWWWVATLCWFECKHRGLSMGFELISLLLLPQLFSNPLKWFKIYYKTRNIRRICF